KMPRKGKHPHNYEDEYADSYDYDEEYDYDYGDTQEWSPHSEDRSKVEGSNKKNNDWRCLNCTYDNPKNCPACDMCGLVRNSSLMGSETGAVVSDGFKMDGLNKQNDVWRCLNCTYDNPKNCLACDMCGLIRNPSLIASETAAVASGSAGGCNALGGSSFLTNMLTWIQSTYMRTYCGGSIHYTRCTGGGHALGGDGFPHSEEQFVVDGDSTIPNALTVHGEMACPATHSEVLTRRTIEHDQFAHCVVNNLSQQRGINDQIDETLISNWIWKQAGISWILKRLDLETSWNCKQVGIGSKLEFCLRIVFSFILEAFAVLLLYMHQCKVGRR
ncbi:hypothetical protein KI387_006738, partial [Taxus chinensis]